MLILGATDQIPGQSRIEFFIRGRNSGNNFPDESELISLVIDREVGFVSEPFNILAKNANTERVECANGQPLRLGSLHHGRYSFSHFVGCLVGKGHCEHGIGTDSFVKQIRDSHRDHPSRASAVSSENENATLCCCYRFQLLRVEIEETGHWRNRRQLTTSTQPSNADPHQIFRCWSSVT